MRGLCAADTRLAYNASTVARLAVYGPNMFWASTCHISCGMGRNVRRRATEAAYELRSHGCLEGCTELVLRRLFNRSAVRTLMISGTLRSDEARHVLNSCQLGTQAVRVCSEARDRRTMSIFGAHPMSAHAAPHRITGHGQNTTTTESGRHEWLLEVRCLQNMGKLNYGYQAWAKLWHAGANIMQSWTHVSSETHTCTWIPTNCPFTRVGKA